MSAAMTSVNPFAMLDDDDDAPAGAVVAGAKKEVTKRTTNAPVKKDTAAAPAKEAAPRAGAKPDNKRPPKREFDRHSGTGRGARSDGHEEKKGGHGKGNWGGKGDTGADGAEDAEPVEPTDEEKAAAEALAEERRKEAAAMTLEEYQKKQAATANEQMKAREPEAVDMKGLKIKAEDDTEEIRIGVVKPTKQEKKEKKAKELFTETNFTSPPIEQASPMGGGRGAFLPQFPPDLLHRPVPCATCYPRALCRAESTEAPFPV